jgi:hypothetical protein
MKYQSATIFIVLAVAVLTMNFDCGCNKSGNPYFDPTLPYIKVSATLSDTSAIIPFGDTLIIKLTIPDTLIANTPLGATQTVVVNTLQTGAYVFHIYRVDTVTKLTDFVVSSNNIFVTDGVLHSFYAVYVSNQRKPFTSSLHIVPPAKGLYSLEVTPQADRIAVNRNLAGGLIVNFAVKNKHWDLLDRYFPGYAAAAANVDSTGYGWYCFKVE